MKIIGMHTEQMSLRGTEIAIFDYAKGCREILNIEPIIFYNINNKNNTQEVINKFKSLFYTIGYEEKKKIDELIEKNKIEAMYMIKAGIDDNVNIQSVPIFVHAVFPVINFKYHGTVFNYVSKWLEEEYGGEVIKHVPHIVELPGINDDLRNELSIPKTSLVFGCYGGTESFDIDFVKYKSIPTILNKNNNIYFIFMNIKKEIYHERVIYIEGTSNIVIKEKFINTCNAMIHARRLGETFGLACFEFMYKGKPVITYKRSKQRNHLDVQNDENYMYSNSYELINIILNFNENKIEKMKWINIASKFKQDKVMPIFNQNFIERKILDNFETQKISLNNKRKILYRHIKRKITRYMDPIYDRL
jgi:hypothetical protein